MALIISRVTHPGSKLSTLAWRAGTTLGPDLRIEDAATDDVYAAMDRLEGSHCPLGARGYSRDGKKGEVEIEYGLLTDPEGRSVAIRVFEGNTAGPTAFAAIAEIVRNGFDPLKMIMVGDRGMITSARIEALQELDESYGWITAPRSPQIRTLMAGTLTRNQVQFASAPAAIPVLTEPASEQRQAFDLIGAPIPVALRK